MFIICNSQTQAPMTALSAVLHDKEFLKFVGIITAVAFSVNFAFANFLFPTKIDGEKRSVVGRFKVAASSACLLGISCFAGQVLQKAGITIYSIR